MKVLIAGASGEVGSHLLPLLLKDPQIEKVTALVRRHLGISNPKLQEVITNFSELENLHLDTFTTAFCCLGTTLKKAGSKAAFKKVDHDYIVGFAQLCHIQGAEYFHLVSAMGANPKSAVFYNRVKGETEEEIKKLGFKTTFIYKPSLLVSKRKEKRIAERMGIVIMNFMNPVMIGPLKRYKSIHVSVVAKGMYARMTHDHGGVQLIESNKI